MSKDPNTVVNSPLLFDTGEPRRQSLPDWRGWPDPRPYRDYPAKDPACYTNDPALRNPR